MEIMIHLNNALLPSCWKGEVEIDVTPQRNVSHTVLDRKASSRMIRTIPPHFFKTTKKDKYACQYARKFQKGTHGFDSHFPWRMKTGGQEGVGGP